MRIIGGEYSGRKIIAPKGDTSRPTTDRTRESLFNIIGARPDFEIAGARVIDLFAGSGALGFEATIWNHPSPPPLGNGFGTEARRCRAGF